MRIALDVITDVVGARYVGLYRCMHGDTIQDELGKNHGIRSEWILVIAEFFSPSG